MARQPVSEINAGSMADIAFLLLIFFLVTTTMDVDTGITRKLPPYMPQTEEADQIKKRNIFIVLVNSRDQLLVKGKYGSIKTLRAKTKEFLANTANDPNLSEQKTISELIADAESKNNDKKVKELKNALSIIGNYPISKGVISLQNDRSTSYDMYIQVQNEVAAAVRELRDELSIEKFGKKFAALNNETKIKAIKMAIPVSVSEAEPKDVGGAN